MIPLDHMNTKDSKILLNEALQKITLQYHDLWTDFDIHDPGITFLELLCYLKQKQQQSMEKIDDKTILQFARILHIKPKNAQPEKVFVEITTEKDTFLPRGTTFLAKQYCYENSKRIFLQNNQIDFIAIGNHIIKYEQNEMAKNSILFQNNENVVIYFRKPLPAQQEFSIYIELLEQNRNAVIDEKQFIPLSTLEWKYYTKNEWHSAQVIQDNTKGFLFSGFITLRLEQNTEHCFFERGFPLSVEVKQYGYEIPPILQYIKYNVAELWQQQTKAMCVSFSKKEFLQNNMVFDEYLAFDNCFVLLCYKENGFVDVESENIVFLVKRLENMLFQLGVSHREELKKQFDLLNEQDIVFHLICFQKEYYRNAYKSLERGTVQQKIIWEEQQKYCIEDSVVLFLKSKYDKGQYWNRWEKCDFLEQKGKKERCYTFEKNNIVFGDNIHGKVPSRIPNNVLFGCLQFTYGKKGKIQKGVICSPEKQQYFDTHIIVNQFQQSYGGENAETIEELIKRMEITALQNTYRAVTAEEYQTLVLNCQGLCVKQVRVLPLYRPYMKCDGEEFAENTVTIVVEPPIQPKNTKLLYNYLQNIEQLLKATKLITTQIFVMLPEYIPLDIYGDFILQYTIFDNQKAIQNVLQQYIEKIQKQNESNMLYHGDFFSLLEGLEYIKEITYLKLELYGSKSNQFGDSTIPPYGKVYLRNCYFNMTYES